MPGANQVDDRGAAAVEFAIVLPLLVLLVFGIIEFGMLFWRAQSLEAAAREGARLASLSQTTSGQVVARVTDTLGGAPFTTAPTVTVVPAIAQPCGIANATDVVTVTVTAMTELAIPIWGTSPITLTGEGEFRCE